MTLYKNPGVGAGLNLGAMTYLAMLPVACVSASALRLSDSHVRQRLNDDHITLLICCPSLRLLALYVGE